MYGLLVSNSAGGAFAVGTATSGSSAAGFYNSTTTAYSTHRTFAELGNGSFAGYFINNNSGRWIQLANASYAYQTSGGASGTFTGAHDGLIPKAVLQPLPGDILVDVSSFAKPNIYDTLSVNAVSSEANQKGVVGVFAEMAADEHIPTALMKMVKDEQGREKPVLDPDCDLSSYNMVIMNSLGEGMMNVCGYNGHISIGDLIVTSPIPGKGMKQDDDIVRSYTVAKARENVFFDSQTEVKQIACIYMCG